MRAGREPIRISLRRVFAPACLAALLAVAPVVVAAPAAHADTDYGGGCALYPDNPQATIVALRDICDPQQQDQIFLDAPRGTVPIGVTNGWVARPPIVEAVAPPLWSGKNFYTNPDGGILQNRILGGGTEGFPANVYSAPSILDGQPVWALDYAPSITPQIWDEIREVTPGVWFGYSWWRGAIQTTPLLTFVLTY